MIGLKRTIIQQWGKDGELQVLVTIKVRGQKAIRILRTGLSHGDVEKALASAVAEAEELVASG